MAFCFLSHFPDEGTGHLRGSQHFTGSWLGRDRDWCVSTVILPQSLCSFVSICNTSCNLLFHVRGPEIRHSSQSRAFNYWFLRNVTFLTDVTWSTSGQHSPISWTFPPGSILLVFSGICYKAVLIFTRVPEAFSSYVHSVRKSVCLVYSVMFGS